MGEAVKASLRDTENYFLLMTKKIKRLFYLLEKEYGNKAWGVHGDPLSVLIGTILSQNTSDNNSHKAFANLRSKFKNWDK